MRGSEMVADRQVSNTHEIDQLAASYWEFFLDEHPVTAMDCGVQKNNHIFFKDAIEDFDHRHRRHLEFRNQLEKLADNSLQGESETTRKLLLRELDEAIQEYDLQAHLRPLWFPFGPELPARRLLAFQGGGEGLWKIFGTFLQDLTGFGS